MNYLLLTEYFPESENAEITGGVESRCFHIVKELSRHHKVTVLCSHQPGQERTSKIFNARIIRCGPTIPYSSKGKITKRLLFSWSLYNVGKTIENVEVVEGASFITYPSAYFLGKKLNARKVATWHETWTTTWIKNKGIFTGIFGELWERFSLKLDWDKIISVSAFTKSKLVSRGIEEGKIRVLHNGIDLEKFRKIKAVKEKKPTICYFGRVGQQKNLGVLVNSVAELKKYFPDIQCKIIGSGPAIEGLKKIAKDLRLEPNVHFLGNIKNHEDLLKEVKKCHIFVNPSTLEGFGITVVEAMALNLPYVISDIEPFIEITNNGKGGEIFRQNDVDDLTNKISLLLKNKKIYSSKIKEEKKLAAEYDWKRMLSKKDYINS
ncbi:MAG: glycosyltransferase family 4 protein [Candidatus Aenigmarchaeota archaeon]|nr:glycosyltransferase family 4 protein [Candidatus Aenigmarchaeota archaeon]